MSSDENETKLRKEIAQSCLEIIEQHFPDFFPLAGRFTFEPMDSNAQVFYGFIDGDAALVIIDGDEKRIHLLTLTDWEASIEE